MRATDAIMTPRGPRRCVFMGEPDGLDLWVCVGMFPMLEFDHQFEMTFQNAELEAEEQPDRVLQEMFLFGVPWQWVEEEPMAISEFHRNALMTKQFMTNKIIGQYPLEQLREMRKRDKLKVTRGENVYELLVKDEAPLEGEQEESEEG